MSSLCLIIELPICQQCGIEINGCYNTAPDCLDMVPDDDDDIDDDATGDDDDDDDDDGDEPIHIDSVSTFLTLSCQWKISRDSLI